MNCYMLALSLYTYTLSLSAAHIIIEEGNMYTLPVARQSSCKKVIADVPAIKLSCFKNFQLYIRHTGWHPLATTLHAGELVEILKTNHITVAAVYSGKKFDLFIISKERNLAWKNIHKNIVCKKKRAGFCPLQQPLH